MPRPLRLQYEDAYYHVINRGRGYQRIFHQNEGYRAFLETLAEARQRFGLEIHAYETGSVRIFNDMEGGFSNADQLAYFLPTQPISNPRWIFSAVNHGMDPDFIP